jgi:peptide/nickel transport system permease protein
MMTIIAETSLSLLGPRAITNGAIVGIDAQYCERLCQPDEPWMSIFPGMAIYLAALGFNLIGDGLRDALDPRAAWPFTSINARRP